MNEWASVAIAASLLLGSNFSDFIHYARENLYNARSLSVFFYTLTNSTVKPLRLPSLSPSLLPLLDTPQWSANWLSKVSALFGRHHLANRRRRRRRRRHYHWRYANQADMRKVNGWLNKTTTGDTTTTYNRQPNMDLTHLVSTQHTHWLRDPQRVT